jgi:hypothetical protein
MATRKEMIKMISGMEDDVKEWIARTIRDYFGRFPEDFVNNAVWHALRHAEDEGMCRNDYYMGELCTVWVVGDYEVTCISNDLDFCAEMLTEDMMDDLIIEEA